MTTTDRIGLGPPVQLAHGKATYAAGGGVALITLTNPPANGYSYEMMRDLDECVLRVLRLKERLGLFDDPYRRGSSAETADTIAARRRLARDVAAKSLVLVKNSPDVLPLTAGVRRVCVLGPLADAWREMRGPWAAAGYEEPSVTVLAGLREALPDADVVHVEGVTIAGAPYRATIGTQVSTATADSEGFANLRNLEVPAECVIEWGLPDPQADPQRPPVYLFKLEMLLDVEREQELMDTAREQDCKKRLNNLGYVISEDTKKNVAAFQNDFQQKYHLRTDGELDDKTMDAIEDVYDKCAKNLRE